jgi:hypothetical protein
MRIAIHHPRAAPSSGRVLADGLRVALVDLGHQADLCGDSDAVIDCAPELVMVVDPACAKLTDHFTVGFVWAALPVVERRTDWHAPISSWDLAVCVCPEVRQFLRDIQFPARDSSAVSELDVYPAATFAGPAGDHFTPAVAIFRDDPVFESAGREREVFDPLEVAEQMALVPAKAGPEGARERLPALLDEAMRLLGSRNIAPELGTITVIIRCGGRPLPFIERAVAAAARQSYPQIALLFVTYKAYPVLEAYVARLRTGPRWASVRCVTLVGGNRSETLWAGLREVDTKLFCLLDDDDGWFSDHLTTLAAALASYPEAAVAHSGTVSVEEWCFPADPANPAPADKEQRALLYLTPFNLEAAMRFDHKIQSNGWLARGKVLRGAVLDNPQLSLAEDIYLFLMMVARYPYIFTGRASAVYYWRSGQTESSRAAAVDEWERQQARMLLRLMRMPFRPNLLGEQLFRRSVAKEPDSDTPARWPITYESALSDGIDFTRQGLPSFVAEISGLSPWESWGRWTMGPALRITFRGALPDAFSLALRALASDANVGLAFTVSAGGCTRQVIFSAEPADVVLAFTGTGGPKVLSITIPRPSAPNAADSREIGLGLLQLSILAAERGVDVPVEPKRRVMGVRKFIGLMAALIWR